MEPKRELTSVDIAALSGELQGFTGAGVDKVYLYPDDFVRFKLRHHERGRIELLVHVGDTKHVRVADPDTVPDAPERPPDFAMMLRNRLAGAELADVQQYEFDRVLELDFRRDDDSTTVVAELFGDGNVVVLDGAGDVIDCVRTVRLKSRTVAPGAPYEFPGARFNPLAVDRASFEARLRDSDTDVVRTLATQLNFGGLWAEELCTRAGVPKTREIAAVEEDAVAALYETVDDLGERLRSGDLDPYVYEEDDQAVDATPVALEEYRDLSRTEYETFTGALDAYFGHLEEGAESESERQRPDFEEEIEKHERIIQQQQSAIEDFEAEADDLRAAAQALYAHYDLVDDILSTIRAARAEDTPWEDIEERFAEGREQGIQAATAVEGIDASAGTVTVSLDDQTVTLDVSEGVEHNADRLYQEAKAVEEKRSGAEAAIADTRAELESIREQQADWEAEEEPSETEDTSAEPAVDWLSRDSIPIRQSEEWYERFRWFHTTDDYLVIGGRNADQNEELVQKYLERGDLFFHAQAHGGPVTILKATGPSEATSDEIDLPESSRHEAAKFAVSYSSVWKDGRFAGDAYAVSPDQVSKTPESGEYLEKGGFAIRGERTYYRDIPVGVGIGIACEPETRVLGGPPAAIEPRVATAISVEPGRFAQNDVAKRLYRAFKDRFADEAFVRKVASPDLIQEFLPPGGSRILD